MQNPLETYNKCPRKKLQKPIPNLNSTNYNPIHHPTPQNEEPNPSSAIRNPITKITSTSIQTQIPAIKVYQEIPIWEISIPYEEIGIPYNNNLNSKAFNWANRNPKDLLPNKPSFILLSSINCNKPFIPKYKSRSNSISSLYHPFTCRPRRHLKMETKEAAIRLYQTSLSPCKQIITIKPRNLVAVMSKGQITH